mmetsp:Transcript_24005/g.50196  ORF Transcript_24005/g.50196 Transcript_24005/m.50196 type:complete len:303 (-) Transcript_24005:390-1298(-)
MDVNTTDAVDGCEVCCDLKDDDSFEYQSMPVIELCREIDETEIHEEYFYILCDVLDQCVSYNDAQQIRSWHRKGSFEGRQVGMKASKYMQRIFKYSGASPCCFISALVYMERFKVAHPTVTLTSKTLQRLLLVPVMLATKYLEDCFCNNACWAEIGGLALRELNTLEIEFILGIGFDLSVHPDDYARRTQDLCRFDSKRRAQRQPRVSARVSSASRRPHDPDPVSAPQSEHSHHAVHFTTADGEREDAAVGLVEAAGALRIAGSGRESAAAAKITRAAAAAACCGKSPTPDGPASPGPPADL